jgi:ribosomal protein S12 methylthiotransferase accessory factor
VPLAWGSGFFFAGSNGLASGNTRFEAISHGICELIERDANTLWRQSTTEERAARRLDLRSVDSAACRDVLDLFERAGIAVCVWDVTSDIGIAAFLCTVADAQPNALKPLRPVAGSGCHPRRDIALLRALTEAAQGRVTIISGARDDLSLPVYDAHDANARLTRFLQMAASVPARRAFEQAPSYDFDTFEEDVVQEMKGLERVGLRQVAFVDLTQDAIGIPVVRVLIPGLEGIAEAPGYAPGPRAQRSAT